MKRNILMKLGYALAISMALVSTSFAIQQQGNYWSSNIGMALQPSITYHGTRNDSFFKTDSQWGSAFETAYGYQMEDIRAEAELLFLKNKIKKSLFQSENFAMASPPNSGSTKVIGFMVNGLYDFDDESDFTPYMGIGIGGVRISLEDHGFPSFTGTTTTSGSTLTINNPAVTTTTTTTFTQTVTTTITSPPVNVVTSFSPGVSALVGSIPPPSSVTSAPQATAFPIADNPPGVTAPFGPTTVPVVGGGSMSSSHLQFAYQLILGVSYKITDFFKISADYRYLRAMPTTFTAMDAGTPDPVRGSYSNHRLMLGLSAFLD